MNPTQFDNLSIGDRVHSSKTGRTFTVLHKTRHAVTVGAFECIVPDVTACEWTVLGAPTEATIKRREYPPLFIMTRELFAAGYVKVETGLGEFWKKGSGVSELQFEDINAAFDWLQDHPARPLETARTPLHTPRTPTLDEMRRELKAAGWRLSSGARVLWTCPTGIPYGNTQFSYRVMRSWR